MLENRVDDLRRWLIARIATLRGIDPRALDPGERFSHLGLDSLLAARLLADLGEQLGRPLSPVLAFEHPSIDALARHLAGAPATAPAARLVEAVDEPVAIVGMACRFPHADDPAGFWRALQDGTDAVTDVPPGRWDPAAYHDPDPAAPGKAVTRRGAFLRDVAGFDASFFGISPREAREIDPQQRLALELAWEALEHAGVPVDALAGTPTGVFLGAMWHDYADLSAGHLAGMSAHRATGQALNMVANRVSYALGLAGPSLVVDTACSSSLVALHLACESLRRRDSALALAGGVNLLLAPATFVAMSKFGGLSPQGRCHAFDARADGFVRGEGGGVVVLKLLSRARADGDRVHCVIRGTAVNNDGFSNGLTAPNPRAQEDVLRDAYRRAGLAPTAVHYVEAHGTGTPLGDPIEARALGAVLGAGRDPAAPLLLGSVKTNLGHLEAAAGIAGVLKAALALAHREVPRSLHFATPSPHIDFTGLHLRVPQTTEPWPAAFRSSRGAASKKRTSSRYQ